MTDPTPTPSRRRWLVPAIVGVVFLLLAGLAVYGGWWWTHRDLTVRGDIAVAGSGSFYTGGMCTTSGGYADIREGAQVVIKDDTGKVVATTTLGPGVSASGTCTFPFSVTVPTGSDFYAVELGRRGSVHYTAEQLAAGVHLTIGG
jgi:hypothetical protein